MRRLLTFLFTLITVTGFSQGITVTVGGIATGSADSLGGKGAAFYVDTATSQNIFGTKTFKTFLQVGDSLLLSFFDTVYKESLNETDFATSTKWTTTGNFSISGGTATFSGTSGTLKQKENKLALTGLGDSRYRFIYAVSNMTGVGCTAFINTDFASSNTNLVLVNATDTLTFTSNSDPNDFKIECTCTSGGFDLDDFSLKKQSDSIVFIKNDLYTNGIFAKGSSAFSGDVQILGSLQGGSPLIISTPIGEIEIDGDIHLIKDDENWTIGIDTSDIDQFKISNDDTLGINDRLVIDTLGNVGIGTTSPGGNLDVGDGVGSAELRVTGQGKIRFLGNSDPNNFIQSGTAYSSGSTSDLFFTGMFGTPNHMVIKAGGSVGIGTTTPDRALEISGTSNNTASVRISSFGSGFSSRLEILRANGTEGTPSAVFAGNQLGQIAYMGHDGTSSADAALIHAVANQNWAVGSHGSRLEFVTILDNTTAFVTRMTIANDGNVGIGTISPDRKLHVEQDNVATNTVTNLFRLTSTASGTPTAGIGVGMEFEAETAVGNNEIGIVVEAVTTDVTSTSEDFDMVFKTMTAGAAANEKMRLTSDSRLGIANGAGNTPQYRLDVGNLSYFAINGNFAHIVQHNSAASEFWSLAPRNGGNFDIAVTTTDPRPSSGTIATSGNAISIKTNKDVEFLGSVGIGTATPNAESLLELESTTKALRLTRMTTTQRTAMTGVSGLIVYDSTLEFIFYHTGSAWVQL